MADAKVADVLQGKLLAGINSRVQLYEWNVLKDGSRGLVAGAGQSGLVLALYLACRGDFIVVGKPSHLYKACLCSWTALYSDCNPFQIHARVKLQLQAYSSLSC